MKDKIDQYLRRTKRCLIFCPRKRRAVFLENLRGDMEAFCQEHPQAEWGEVEEAFGSPMKVAESFFKEVSFEEAVQSFRLRQRIFRLVCVILVVLSLIAVILGTVYVVGAYNYAHGQGYETPAIEGTAPPDFDNGAIEVYGD